MTSLQYIREPHKNDVLFGRGGGINNHPGNRNYRNIVHEYKEAYTLSTNKQDKTDISNKVIALVHMLKPPGKFLARSKHDPSLWEEVSVAEAIKKTSQALREGAPKIRAKALLDFPAQSKVKTPHQRLSERISARTSDEDSKKKKRNANDITDFEEGTKKKLKELLAPVDHTATVGDDEKRAMVAEMNAQARRWINDAKLRALNKVIEKSVSIQIPKVESQKPVDQLAMTPPLSPRLKAVKAKDDVNRDICNLATEKIQSSSDNGFKRIHSLATSDADPYEGVNEPAKNPFNNEYEQYGQDARSDTYNDSHSERSTNVVVDDKSFTSPFEVTGERLNYTAELHPTASNLVRDISVPDVDQITFRKDNGVPKSSNRSFSISQLTDLDVITTKSPLRRYNSLALSDVDNGELNTNDPFRNPFSGESPGRISFKRSTTDRSLTSELTDLPELNKGGYEERDFDEGMCSISESNNGVSIADLFAHHRIPTGAKIFGRSYIPKGFTSSQNSQ